MAQAQEVPGSGLRGRRIDIDALQLPEAMRAWIGESPVYECSGASGARTLFIDGQERAYLKLAAPGALARAAQMQRWWHERGFSAALLCYLPGEQCDCMLTAPVTGVNGVAPEHLARPERLCRLFGEALRRLHDADTAGCPADALAPLLQAAPAARCDQQHLDDIAPFIGPANAEEAPQEIIAGAGLLKRDALIHGDCCLPNLMLDDWRPTGFIDIADSGVGDRHYDLAEALWSIAFNLNRVEYGDLFLNAYGRDAIDAERLRICGLLTAME